MSYYPTIFSDPKAIAYPSRTKQLNVREKQCFRAVDESHLLRDDARKDRSLATDEKSGRGPETQNAYDLGVLFPRDSENGIEKVVTRVFLLENRYFSEQTRDC